jgi:hypothetical protein
VIPQQHCITTYDSVRRKGICLAGGFDEAAAAGDDGELFGVEDLAGLLFGMVGPGTDGVEADVGEPVAEGAATVALALVGEGEVVVGVGVLGDEGDGLLVGLGGFGETLHLVEDVAEVEEGEGIFGIGDGGAAVEALGLFVVALVVVDCAEIDEGGGMLGLDDQDGLIGFDGLGDGGGGLFELDGVQEHVLNFGGLAGVVFCTGVDDAELAGGRGVEVEGELLGEGVHEGAAVTEAEAGAATDEAGFHEGVAHAGDALHGGDGGFDVFRGDAGGGLKVAEVAELAEGLEGVVLGGGDEFCPFPRDELAGVQVKDPDYVLTAISGHDGVSVGTVLPFVQQILFGVCPANLRQSSTN